MKIAYVFTEVPRMAGTFANAELDGMKARGAEIELFTLRRWGTRNEETERLEALFPVHRSPYFFSFTLIRGVLAELFRNPRLILSTLVMVVRDASASPPVLIKSVGIFPKAIHFGRLVRGDGYDLIHAYWASLPALAASVMSRISGVPFTMWAHASADIYHRSLQTDRALSTRLREARMVLTCHSSNLQHFRELNGEAILEKVVLQTHGVDLTRFRPIPRGMGGEGIITITAVGRLLPVKGFNVLVDACGQLHRKGYDFRCRIVGPGRPADVLSGRPREDWLPERLEFVGEVGQEALPAIYSQTHILAVPSVIDPAGGRDGLPNVLLEAMASGVACVGTSVGSIPEVIIDGKTGLLVPPGDVVALAGALEKLMENPDLREQLGREGARFVRMRYGREVALDGLAGLLRSVCSSRSDGHPTSDRAE